MQPISGTPPRPPGEGPVTPNTPGEQPLSTQQRTVLERLITRLIALTSQQNAEVWAGVKHDLGVRNDAPLQSRHFPAAEQNLNQRLTSAQQQHTTRQIISQLTELLGQGNNRQAVSDFIRQQYGHTALSQLSPEQLKTVLTLLQSNQLSIPQPQQRPSTERPLQPAEHNTLKQMVTKLAAATGEPTKLIWQSMLELSGVKAGEMIPAKQFTHLVTWLQARQTLSTQSAPTAQRTGGAETTAGTARVRYDPGLRSAELAGYAANGADDRPGAGCAQSDLRSPRRAGRRRAGGKKHSADLQPAVCPRS